MPDGLLYPYAFGRLDVVGDGNEGTLLEISRRGFLRCGVHKRSGLAEFNATLQQWSGLEVDLCRAISAAIFDGVFSSVQFVEVLASERFVQYVAK